MAKKSKKEKQQTLSADFLRGAFLQFFQSKKHKLVASDSLVPTDDPTVLFTSAGMNQFKKQFMGHLTGFRRATTSQRCLRTDDLDKVGKTNCHHTFFEMLGNFSFGDYFKKDAIAWAWEFLTNELKISEDKLWVSVYKDDDESFGVWKNDVGFPERKIVKLGDKDNFWPAEAKEKGPNGPCGPCSEIFYDWGADVGCKKPDCSPACSCGRFVEIWNLVFTQFNRKADASLEPLPNKNIDTGMGLERLASVMQGKESNFESDLFIPIIAEIKKFVRQDNQRLVWAIADHIRAIVFSIYDGVMPSNEQRGYVVRKLIRKSAFDGCTLGITKPFLYKLVPVVCEVMREPYPDLKKRREEIARIILIEEKNFSSILNNATKLFTEKFKAYLAAQGKPSKGTGMIAFELYDTYGIPFEVTRSWAEKNAIAISMEEFDARLKQQKELSKAKSSMKGDVFAAHGPRLKIKETRFIGYHEFACKAKILGIMKNDALVAKAQTGDEVKLILDKTVFYAESGGQVADIGGITKAKAVFQVTDVQKIDGVFVHAGKVIEGKFSKNDAVSAAIDKEYRLSVARNHTATHLLQAALRKVLGEHVQQQGSLVAADKLRFDFTHFEAIARPELDRIEYLVNQHVIEDAPVAVEELNLAQAKEKGFLAFFGEKYRETVRAVKTGDVSKELCGGTHLDRTGQIGFFRITSESSISSGVRRIEALTGNAALKSIKKDQEVLGELTAKLNAPIDAASDSVDKLSSRLKDLQRQVESLKFGAFVQQADSLIAQASVIKDIKVITHRVDDIEMGLLRRMADLLREKFTSGIFVLGSTYADKVFLVLGVSKDLVQKGFDAGKLIREVSAVVGGSGGGRSDFAQSGGTDPQKLDAALKKLMEII